MCCVLLVNVHTKLIGVVLKSTRFRGFDNHDPMVWGNPVGAVLEQGLRAFGSCFRCFGLVGLFRTRRLLLHAA